jgi:hypothetical protein
MGGVGLIGMRERVALVGGELQAGPARDGGFRVEARLPTGAATTDTPTTAAATTGAATTGAATTGAATTGAARPAPSPGASAGDPAASVASVGPQTWPRTPTS